MKSKTILGADGATKMRQITVGIHGKGGETGIKAIMLIIQQAPIATGQQAEPQQTPPAAAGEPAGGLGEKEGVNNAD